MKVQWPATPDWLTRPGHSALNESASRDCLSSTPNPDKSARIAGVVGRHCYEDDWCVHGVEMPGFCGLCGHGG